MIRGGGRVHRRWAPLATVLALILLIGAWAGSAQAQGPEGEDENSALPEILQQATFDQHPGDKIPVDARFRDDTGREVQLGEYFRNGKPTLLTMNYYECDSLCPLVLDGLVRGLNGVSFTLGDDFNVVTVSIDPDETPELADETKRHLINRYGRSDAARRWAFLTGEREEIDRLAQAVGVNYAYDEESKQYAHPSGAVVLTADGTISRYIYGMEFSPRDLRLALVEAADGKIGGVVDQVLLFCYRYDPTAGEYTPVVLNLMKLGGAVTVLVLGMFLGSLFMRDIRHKQLSAEG